MEDEERRQIHVRKVVEEEDMEDLDEESVETGEEDMEK
jgi:hypothetical protein